MAIGGILQRKNVLQNRFEPDRFVSSLIVGVVVVVVFGFVVVVVVG